MISSGASTRGVSRANQAFLDYYRCPDRYADMQVAGDLTGKPGYFRFGESNVIFGSCSSGVPQEEFGSDLHDSLPAARIVGGTLQLPFDPTETTENLRFERYAREDTRNSVLHSRKFIAELYYLLRPLMPVSFRRRLQRVALRGWDEMPFPLWPVDDTVGRLFEQLLILRMKAEDLTSVPFIWFWPKRAPGCVIMTHDVETSRGVAFCSQLMDMDDTIGLKSSFQVIPEKRYRVSDRFLESLRVRRFEVNVHDLNHDGRLFQSRSEFTRRVQRINRYGREFRAQGFRSAVLYRNAEWYDLLEFSYDMSIPNVGHLDPQRGGCCTVMPYAIGNILELPLTTTQDYSLFHILQDHSMRHWQKQIEAIVARHGLISFNIHPDYIVAPKPRAAYRELLRTIADVRERCALWSATPGEVDRWWRQRSKMSLECHRGVWRIEGPGSERASIARAELDGDRLVYTFAL